MPKLDILEAMVGKKVSGCEMDFRRHSGNTKKQQYNLVVHLAISNPWDGRKKTFNRTNISLDSVEKYI